jgi:hypothetical protein
VQRKLGDGFDALIADIRAEAADPPLVALTDAVEICAATFREAEPADRLAGSYPFLTMCSVMVAGWLLERLGRAIDAEPALDDFLRGRRAAVDYFLAAIVPEALGLGAAAASGADSLYRVPAEALL